MKKYIIIIPVYNDWQSVLKLIDNIDLQINNQNVDIIIINDASTEAIDDGTKRTYSKINSVKVTESFNIEKYYNLMNIVYKVVCEFDHKS